MGKKTEPATVFEAVRSTIAGLPSELRSGWAAATALALAGELDDPGNSATSKSMVARSLREVMDSLASLQAAEPKKDRLDELAGRRRRRVGRVAAS